MMNFEKVILWGAREIERARAKRECRREAKLNKKRDHSKKRESANRESARVLLSQLRELFERVQSRTLTLSHAGKENNRDEKERESESEKERAQRSKIAENQCVREGMLGFITITKQQTKNEKNRKAVLE